jgi:adenylosuccinate synthase
VLSSFDEVKLGVAYKVDGETLPFFPASLEVLGKVEVVYETYPGWKCDITKAKTFEVQAHCVKPHFFTFLLINAFSVMRGVQELPKEAQTYVRRIEELLECPIAWVS